MYVCIHLANAFIQRNLKVLALQSNALTTKPITLVPMIQCLIVGV